MPTDGNVAPLALPAARPKSAEGDRWEAHTAAAKMCLKTCKASGLSETSLRKVFLDQQWKESKESRFPKIR